MAQSFLCFFFPLSQTNESLSKRRSRKRKSSVRLSNTMRPRSRNATRPKRNRSRTTSPPREIQRDSSSTTNFFICDEANPRSFSHKVKQQCWEKADKLKGRDPDRWRRDALGNIVFRKLVGCAGCLCHDYDHILPYSKGGKSTLENCQVLQATVNRSKGNKIETTEVSKSDLIQKSSYCRVSGRDMDLLELSAYGNVRRGPDTGFCNIQ